MEPVVDSKYILTPKLWEYLYNYAKKHAAKGNGFGFGLVNPENKESIARTLSARYHKDGSEILIDRGWDMATGETDFANEENQAHRPRRLTPRECARLRFYKILGSFLERLKKILPMVVKMLAMKILLKLLKMLMHINLLCN